MGKKWNAYSLFVEYKYRELTRNGERVIKPHLFQKLNDTWKNLPDFIKDQFKLHAKKDEPWPLKINYNEVINVNKYQSSGHVSNEEPLALPPVPVKSDQDESTSSNIESQHTRQGIKRLHEDEDTELIECDTRIKKHKPGIPGWLKDEDEVKLETTRYKDYHLYVSRRHCESLIESRSDRLIDMPIYSFSVNVLCQDTKGDYLPLEMTIYSYSLKDGRTTEPLHIFIDPGDIPIGCQNFAQDHSKKHRICYPFNTEHRESYVRSDYKRIYRDILKYTQDGERTLLLNNEVDLEQAKGTIEWLYKKATEGGAAGIPKPATWSIFLITDFIAAMHNFIRQKRQNLAGPRFALHYKLRAMLERGTLDHHPELICEYHKNPERETAWCTRSCAIRTITNIQDILEETYNLYKREPVIPKILPVESKQ